MVRLAAIIIGIGVACGVGLMLLFLCNPMALVFLVSFEVVNESEEHVWVTPIGMLEGSGEYGPLPRYRAPRLPALPLRGRGRHYEIPLRAGESVKITYDWDDINFRHILVRTESGDVLIVDTDKLGTRGSCYAAQKSRYAIPSLQKLRRAAGELAPCAEGQRVAYSRAKEYP
jgi:hypothetical protein